MNGLLLRRGRETQRGEETARSAGKQGPLSVGFRKCLGGCLWLITDLAETWWGDSGQPKKLPGTHIFAFGCVLGDVGRILRKNMEKNEKWFFSRNSFPLGFMKKLVCIWYQDLRSGYAHVKFQPHCSKGVNSIAIGRSGTFTAYRKKFSAINLSDLPIAVELTPLEQSG